MEEWPVYVVRVVPETNIQFLDHNTHTVFIECLKEGII